MSCLGQPTALGSLLLDIAHSSRGRAVSLSRPRAPLSELRVRGLWGFPQPALELLMGGLWGFRQPLLELLVGGAVGIWAVPGG